jgi:hypothetical protein
VSITILGDSWVFTRASHICWGCGEVKNKGTRMHCVRQIVDGRAASNYWCVGCERIIETLSPEDTQELSEGIDCGTLKDWV